MSDKEIICIASESNLYERKNDESDCIYIEVHDISECCFEVWTSEDQKVSRAQIKIKKEDFEKMIHAYKCREN